MKVSYKAEWEILRKGDCRRMKVPGGWIFNTWSNVDGGDVGSESCCFVPDPKHEWFVEPEQEEEKENW